jgi:radical SAM superfamily enzyme YgiQ (UPF0313 family)
VKVLLVSTYDLGRQPFGLASPAAWLRADGHQVTLADLSRSPLPASSAGRPDLIAFFLPMHTATRLALPVVKRMREAHPDAHLCAYGLYAPLNADALRKAGVATILGGEFEEGLRDLAREVRSLAYARGSERSHGREGVVTDIPEISLARQRFLVPDRAGLPGLNAYAQLVSGGARRLAGHTEASRGCKHLCRHCPVVPVYGGIFRIVQRDVVMEDIRRQVAAGAEHITFGDPDFFNGPGHAIPIVEALHREWPALTYDVTIKIEHLLQHRELLPILKATGCLFVVSAVESFDDAVLERLAKGHTRTDFEEALRLMRAAGLALSPTFIPFTPWTTRESYRDFLSALVELELADLVAPIQLAIRLLVTQGSLLLELPEVRAAIGAFDPLALTYPWRNPDAALDGLAAAAQRTVAREERRATPRIEIFRKIWEMAEAGPWPAPWNAAPRPGRATIPYLTEPWYC